MTEPGEGQRPSAGPPGVSVDWRSAAVDRVAPAPSSHVTTSARRPCMAAHVLSAITAIPVGIWMTSLTPGTARALAASKLVILPPITGQCSTTA